MQRDEFPDATYTTTWSNGRGEVRFFTRPDGSRLRYYTAGTGPPVVLTHTVRTQLDYFQRVIPLLWDHYTVFALDLPGMGWSDIVPGTSYDEPELRAAVVEFVSGLDLYGVTLAGESLGAALALSASIDLKDRVSRIRHPEVARQCEGSACAGGHSSERRDHRQFKPEKSADQGVVMVEQQVFSPQRV
jgi:hypothetical protein